MYFFCIEGVDMDREKYTILSSLTLGITTGLMIGLANSPVAGAAVTGMLSIVSIFSVVPIGGKKHISPANWRRAAIFISCFSMALIVGGIGGMFIKLSQPSPADQLIRKLEKLNLSKQDIAKGILNIAQKSEDLSKFMNLNLLYSDQPPNISSNNVEQIRNIQKCARLIPNGVTYTDIEIINGFNSQGGNFKKVVDFVKQKYPDETDDNKLLMLRMGYFILCDFQ